MGPTTILLTALLLFSAFTRFTHGNYSLTKFYHDFQTYHHPDDGSAAARMIPIMDATFAIGLWLDQTRFISAATATVLMAFGTLKAATERKSVGGVAATTALGIAAVWEIWSAR